MNTKIEKKIRKPSEWIPLIKHEPKKIYDNEGKLWYIVHDCIVFFADVDDYLKEVEIGIAVESIYEYSKRKKDAERHLRYDWDDFKMWLAEVGKKKIIEKIRRALKRWKKWCRANKYKLIIV